MPAAVGNASAVPFGDEGSSSVLVAASAAVLHMLVCVACPVSVAVRLACLGMTRATRDAGHHSRFVQGVCYLPALHGALVWHRWLCLWAPDTHRRPLTRGLPGRPRDAIRDGDQSAQGIAPFAVQDATTDFSGHCRIGRGPARAAFAGTWGCHPNRFGRVRTGRTQRGPTGHGEGRKRQARARGAARRGRKDLLSGSAAAIGNEGGPRPGNGLATPDGIDLTSEEGLQRCNTQAAKVTLPRRAASGIRYSLHMRAVHEPD